MLSVAHRTSAVRSWTRHCFGWRHTHATLRRVTRASSLMASVSAAGGRSYAVSVSPFLHSIISIILLVNYSCNVILSCLLYHILRTSFFREWARVRARTRQRVGRQ